MVQIKEYTPEFEQDFKKINLHWLNQYDLLEGADVEVLNNLQSILGNNGYMFIAVTESKLVGTVGLTRHADEFELVKMAVATEFQGKGIGKLLLETALNKAIQAGARKISLFSSSRLTTALKLYEKYGFVSVPNLDSPFATADIKMELVLEGSQRTTHDNLKSTL